MTRLLTGVQSSGEPHLGNILGAIKPAIEKGRASNSRPFYFIADKHSLTTISDAQLRISNTQSVAAAWLAFGCDIDNTILYRQSQIPQVCELSWYLSCFTPVGLLNRAHAFKDKSKSDKEPKAGLLFYPVLMAADILLYDATHVPVGKDQKQHIEIARNIARSMNHIYGQLFVLPEAVINSEIMVPGTDGAKMSKSQNNVINIFQTDKKINQAVMKIVTDCTPVKEPKNPDTCTVFKIFALISNTDEEAEMRRKYLKGGFGYGDAKKALVQLILNTYGEEREKYQSLIKEPDSIYDMLSVGEETARAIAEEKLAFIRDKLGFKSFRAGL